jgi:phosphoribosylanthranilate isomerase
MTYIKICGIKNEADALGVAEAGADYIGLVFAESPRQVTPESAAKITSALKKNKTNAKSVGVFVNTAPQVVQQTATQYNLDFVQLSGDEDLDYCRLLNFPLIKVIRLSNSDAAEKLEKQIFKTHISLFDRHFIIMLDVASKGKYGGTGETFDWKLAKPIVERCDVIIAGGLNAENVGEAIGTLKPWGVDVSTGVETKGVKDMKKIIKFIKAVREADASQT